MYSNSHAQTKKIDMNVFLEQAIFNGLVTEDFPVAIIEKMLQNPDSFFVPKCRICTNVQLGMEKYVAHQKQKKAIITDQHKQKTQTWKNSNGAEKCYNLQTLVHRYVDEERYRQKLSEEEYTQLQSDFAIAKKQGMTNKHLSNIPARTCPSCEGANR